MLGNLGDDPETRFTPSGTRVTSASLATDETWVDPRGGRRRRTEWHRLVFWRRLYWKPPRSLLLANAAHVRNLPGRKSDMNDAVWIADLLAHGLIKASQHLRKGVRVCVEGRLQTRKWEDPRGHRHSVTEIVVTDLRFVDGAGGPGGARPPVRSRGRDEADEPEADSAGPPMPQFLGAAEDDGLPF